ncbi:hypothetical protein F5X97DRAFT_320766 [Nemania serpens]|nr:hypothetical protein F5X97DRAFT_320766 [Nemania serpens]
MVFTKLKPGEAMERAEGLSSNLNNCWKDPEHKWCAFKIPRTLRSLPPLPSLPARQTTILSLPTELVLALFHLLNSGDQFKLAISCKRLLAISSMVTILIPSATIHRTLDDINWMPCDGLTETLLASQQLDASDVLDKDETAKVRFGLPCTLLQQTTIRLYG